MAKAAARDYFYCCWKISVAHDKADKKSNGALYNFNHCVMKLESIWDYSMLLCMSRTRSTCYPFSPPASARSNIHRNPNSSPASPSLLLPPVFVRLVLLASVGVSRGLLRESGGSDSMCGCWLWWWGFEKIPFCCTAPPAIIFELALGCLDCVCV